MANDHEGMQAELFSGFAGSSRQRSFDKKIRPKTRGKVTLVLPYENLVFLIIVLIMAFMLSFSLGVEHGKDWANRAPIAFEEPVILAESASEEEAATPEEKLAVPQEEALGVTEEPTPEPARKRLH